MSHGNLKRSLMTVGKTSGINEEDISQKEEVKQSVQNSRQTRKFGLIRPVWTVASDRSGQEENDPVRENPTGRADWSESVGPTGPNSNLTGRTQGETPMYQSGLVGSTGSGSDWVSPTGLSDRSGQSDRSVRSVRPVQNAQWRLELKEWFWDLDKEHN